MGLEEWPFWKKCALYITIIAISIDLFIFFIAWSADNLFPRGGTFSWIDGSIAVFFSILLPRVISLVTIWISLYSSFYFSKKYALQGQKGLSILGGIIAPIIVFFVLYFILPMPLLDARTNAGRPTFYNIESIMYLAQGGFFLFITVILSIIISIKTSKEFYSQNINSNKNKI